MVCPTCGTCPACGQRAMPYGSWPYNWPYGGFWNSGNMQMTGGQNMSNLTTSTGLVPPEQKNEYWPLDPEDKRPA